ncbi:hypothetical protein [Streptomyces sp. NPDC001401]|uniref:hypothetical protein n=1 Tax=Streptomyces sp. NPDC001401 TaxID=3364570 RepID=UPI00368CE785
MSDGFYYWYRSARHAVSADRVIEALEANGVVLANPATGAVTAITNGPESWGEQVSIGRRELLASLSLGIAEEVNFQLWLNDETDVFTRFRSVGDAMTVVEFGLDGMTAAEQEEVIFAVSQAVETDRKGTMGLVIDRRGVTEDADWDSLVRGAPVPLGDWPDLLGVRLDVAARHPQLAAAQGRVEPPLMILARDP